MQVEPQIFLDVYGNTRATVSVWRTGQYGRLIPAFLTCRVTLESTITES